MAISLCDIIVLCSSWVRRLLVFVKNKRIALLNITAFFSFPNSSWEQLQCLEVGLGDWQLHITSAKFPQLQRWEHDVKAKRVLLIKKEEHQEVPFEVTVHIYLYKLAHITQTQTWSCFVLQVIVLESTSRFGGWLWSTRRSDGAVFEHGPRGIRPAGLVGRNTLNMVKSHACNRFPLWMAAKRWHNKASVKMTVSSQQFSANRSSTQQKEEVLSKIRRRMLSKNRLWSHN